MRWYWRTLDEAYGERFIEAKWLNRFGSWLGPKLRALADRIEPRPDPWDGSHIGDLIDNIEPWDTPFMRRERYTCPVCRRLTIKTMAGPDRCGFGCIGG
jgi:hypothetical protein